MSMLGFGKKLLKSTVQVAVTPVELVRDVVTLGGLVTDEDEPYTVQRLRKASEDFEDALDELDD